MKSKESIQNRIAEIEREMEKADFWQNKEEAQKIVKEYNELKSAADGVGKYDKGDAVVTIFSGAGGDDAEDVAGMLFRMYRKYIAKREWTESILTKI